MTDVTPDGTYIIADAVRFVPKANVPKIASWSFTVASTGSYKLYAKWPASSAHATDAQFTVTHASGTSTVTANQRINGGQWNLLGTYTFNAGASYKVELSDQITAGKVAADAIYIAGTAAPADSFTWTPALPSAGSWRILVRWPVSSGNTAAARYTVTHAGGTTTVTLNQKQNGGIWNSLGTYSLTPGAGHKVTLAGSSDGATIADAILFAGPTVQPANLLYVHADQLGSPQKLTNTSQAIVWDGVFDPFGEEVSITGLAAMPMRFPGQYADEEMGYSYNYFRDYEPSLGRYLQRDPIGLIGGLNAFAYVGQNPVTWSDPRGLLNPLKAIICLLNAANAGRLYASGMGKYVAAGAASGTIVGMPAAPVLIVAGTWSLYSAQKAQQRAMIQCSEAQCEKWDDASSRNILGLAPFGQHFDDPDEPLPWDWAKQQYDNLSSNLLDVLGELGTLLP